MSTPEIRYEDTTSVYHKIMTKVCNARFGEIVKNYAEINAMKGKGKLAFRAGLLAPQNDSNSLATKSSEIDSSATPKSTTMSRHKLQLKQQQTSQISHLLLREAMERCIISS